LSEPGHQVLGGALFINLFNKIIFYKKKIIIYFYYFSKVFLLFFKIFYCALGL
jgi:hypothetical protein